MAEESCCNLRCFSYFVGILTIVTGVLRFIDLSIVGIIGGLLTIGLGALLIYGIHKEKAQYIFTYVIIEVVLLVILIIFSIVGLVNHQNGAQSGVGLGAGLITFLLLIPVYLYYRQLSRSRDTQTV